MDYLLDICIIEFYVALAAVVVAIKAVLEAERRQRKLDIIFALAKTRNNTVYEILASEDAE